MYERRLTVRLESTWERLRGDDPLPRIEQFNPASIADIWDNCFRLRIESGGKRYIYEYFGSNITSAVGQDLTQRSLNAKERMFPGVRIVRKIDSMITDAKVIIDEGSFPNDKNEMVKFRACLLPFGSNSEVSHVIGGISWKKFG